MQIKKHPSGCFLIDFTDTHKEGRVVYGTCTSAINIYAGMHMKVGLMSEAIRDLLQDGDFGDNHFVLVEAHQIFRVTEGGKVLESLGFVMDDSVAKSIPMYEEGDAKLAFQDGLVRKLRLVLTNGTNSFMLDKPIVVLDGDPTMNNRSSDFLSKFSKEELEVLRMSTGATPLPQDA